MILRYPLRMGPTGVRITALACGLAIGACGFSVGGTVDGDGGLAPGEVILVDDTAADFAANVGLTDAVIAPRGVIEPAAFVLGGLHARAYAGNLLGDADTWDTALAEAAGATFHGEGYRQVPADWAATVPNRPRGLGIPGTDNWTVHYDGEILLPAGMVALELAADDRAIAYVALDGTTFGPRLFSKGTAQQQMLDVPAAGWYPIRIAMSQGGGSADLALTLRPAFASAIVVDGNRLRARVTNTPGLLVFAFGDRALSVPLGESAATTAAGSFGTAAPALDLDVPADLFSMRYAGQLRIDTAGTYTFAVDVGADTSDGFRLWIDGALVANHWASLTDALTASVTLTEGWHDLLLDHAENTGGASVELRMVGPGVPDGPIPTAMLRPAVAFGLTASYVGATPTALVDASVNGPSTTTVQAPLVGPPGAVMDAVDIGLGIANQRMSDLTADVLDCHGSTPLPLPAQPGYVYLAARTDCAGTAVMPPPTWGYRVIDSVVGNDLAYAALVPGLYFPLVVATYHGGDRLPYAPAMTFVSSPRRITGASTWGKVGLTAELGGATLTLEIRTAADEAALETAEWIAVPDQQIPRGRPSELLQYRLSVAGTGWERATIDRVEIRYVVDVAP